MDEMKLELRLGPPGGDVDEYPSTNPSLCLGHPCAGAKRGFSSTIEPRSAVYKQQTKGDLGKQQCPPPPPSHSSKNAADSAKNSSQTRITSTPVVGWPPIRSFRRSLASSSRPRNGSKDGGSEKAAKLKTSSKGLFVKINMDGIPIGRKVDLKAYDSYEKLSVAVDELFRGLLAAQRDPKTTGNLVHPQKEIAISGLLDGSGEYTLVYEDEEGDLMLAGDVPWEMFVSTAKRLRVLKSSELSTLRLGTSNRKSNTMDCGV